MNHGIKILDCTLRDGGYYNNWDFDEVLVSSYLKAIAQSKIDFVELGLRNFSKLGFHGAFAYTTESFLNQLELPQGPSYGVMVDAKTILESGRSVEDAVDELFVNASESKLILVRIAAHFHEVDASGTIASKLKEKGYLVGFNLMQAGGKASNLITEKAEIIDSWNCVDALYFADSLGNMDHEEVCRIIKAIQSSWSADIGIHTHNNMGKALDNTLSAAAEGVTWLDVTVTGMGRGAGNAQTENLLAVLSKESSYYQPASIYELVIKHFAPMQNKCGWGSSLPYFLGAQNDIHPTYIQNLLTGDEYGDDEIVAAIDYLSQLEGTTSFNGDILKSAISFSGNSCQVTGTNVLVDIFADKEVLIIANGPSTKKYAKHIEDYITANQPIVLALNIITEIEPSYIDYYCISHNSKFISQGKLYSNLNKPIIAPLHRFSSEEKSLLVNSNDILDFGFEVVDDLFNIQDEFCQVPYEITMAYALSIAKVANATAIKMVGVDGYSAADHRQMDMIDMLNRYIKSHSTPELTALTPTTYPITQSSIFAPT